MLIPALAGIVAPSYTVMVFVATPQHWHRLAAGGQADQEAGEQEERLISWLWRPPWFFRFPHALTGSGTRDESIRPAGTGTQLLGSCRV